MAENVLHRTGAKIVDSMGKVAEVKGRISDVVEEGVDTAARKVKQGREAAEEFMEDAAHTVRRNPLQSVALTFGVAFGMGVMVGWLLRGRRD